MAQMFPRRNPTIPSMPNSYDGPTEHQVRSRRSEAKSNQADNKKELDIDRIMRVEDTRITLMIINIPNNWNEYRRDSMTRRSKFRLLMPWCSFWGVLVDPNYGARPVKCVIQQYIENELANGILRGEFKDENTTLVDKEVTAFSNGQVPQQKLVFKKFNYVPDQASEEGQRTFSWSV